MSAKAAIDKLVLLIGRPLWVDSCHWLSDGMVRNQPETAIATPSAK
jgi:hypothetical protein